jgi:hypothetical protein
MIWPWFISLALIGSIAALTVMRIRQIRGINDKVKRGEMSWDDEWDPFA